MQHSAKIVVVGDVAVGKTSLVSSFVHNEFEEEYTPYTSLETDVANINIDSQPWNLNIAIAPGGESHTRLRPQVYRGADIVLLCFDVSKPASFESIYSLYWPEIASACPTAPLMVVALKVDLRNDSATLTSLSSNSLSVIDSTQGQELTNMLAAKQYVECSAATQQGVHSVFEEAARAIAAARGASSAATNTSSPISASSVTSTIRPARKRRAPDFSKLLKIRSINDVTQVMQHVVPATNEEDDAVTRAKPFKTNIEVEVGEFDEVTSQREGCELRFSHSKHTTADPSGSTFVLALSFCVKPDVETFSLGELSGSVKNILGLASDKLHYTLKSSVSRDEEKEDAPTVFTLTLTFTNASLREQLTHFLDYYDPKRFNFKFLWDSVTTRDTVRLFENLLRSQVDAKALTLLRATKHLRFGIGFDDMTELHGKVFSGLPNEYKFINWNTVTALIQDPLRGLLSKQELPPPVKETYKKVQNYLDGLHSIRLSVGDHELLLQCDHFDVFTLLPTLD
ncbi:RHO4 protein [Balamuthia mandrillaris]